MNKCYLILSLLYVLFVINYSSGQNTVESVNKSNTINQIKENSSHSINEISNGEKLIDSNKATNSQNDSIHDIQSHQNHSVNNKVDLFENKLSLNVKRNEIQEKKGSKKRSVDNPYAFNIEDILRMGNNRRTKRMKRNPNFDGAIPLIGLISNSQNNNYNTPDIERIPEAAFAPDLAEDDSVYSPIIGENEDEYEEDSPKTNFLLESGPYKVLKSNGYPFRETEERPEPPPVQVPMSNFYPFRRVIKSYYSPANYLKYAKNPKTKWSHSRYPWTNDEEDDDIQKKIRILAYLFKEQLPFHKNHYSLSEVE